MSQKKKSVKKSSLKKKSVKKSVKKPQDATLRNVKAANNKFSDIVNEIRELKEVVGSSHGKYQKQQDVKKVLESSGLDSQETIKVYAQILAIVWGS